MTHQQPIELDTLLASAADTLRASQAIINDLLLDEDAVLLSQEPLEHRGRLLELTLQYRLDLQNALSRLLGLEPILLQLLGVGPHYSQTINLERLAFALGNDDLSQLLYLLGELLHSLLRIASRYQHQAKSYREAHSLGKTPYKRFYLSLQKACELQKAMLKSLDSLEQTLKQLVKQAAIGPVLDHLAALRGPISQFHQALLNGLDCSAQFYKTTYPHLKLEEELGSVLARAEPLFKPASYPAARFKPENTPSPERLEQRAAAKRLGNFFNH
ncbi:hypothetical protein DIZ81_10060 [Legionella taurinensis]|uniref:Uncharacterized protein n=1 Tax=Legionella taurinensis TaxID=70611 RepID=A0A3A5LBP4_9GAMM|nr:hypothetical protein [Legionella taurinensis]MDX1837933.1 hypothetical protein [Legionella taurinensis]PUT39472.1 hypothetical protein DB744_10070 [Legionella taurinensis]PUT41781.1 hypothetical protein DB746_08985 [Legionella taurinensis]PUT44615.1 hypothetical protein DB743_08200 [Legionella taurinensis]PUT46859.1 hypothetical protein DB745_10065 [Legionella taurinensis]